jgi:hypothetical protein
MDAIAFIEKDMKRGQKKSATALFLFSIVTVLFPAVFGVLLRDGYEDVFNSRTFVPNTAAAILLFLFPFFYDRRNQFKSRVFRLVLFCLLFALFLATDRVYFPPAARTVYLSNEDFWHESWKCFAKGAFTIALMGIFLSYFVFGVSSWPSRRWRILAALTSGVSRAVMLGFHCDSSSFSHVLVGHMGPGFVVGSFVFGLQEVIFFMSLKKIFPKLAERISNFTKIG